MKNRIDKQHNKIPNLILAVITPHTAGLIALSFVSMEYVFKLACLLITATVGVSVVMIGASVSEYVHSHTSKKEDEVIILEKDIYEDLGTNKISIDVNGTDAILSVSAEEYLRVLSTKRQKSSLLYT